MAAGDGRRRAGGALGSRRDRDPRRPSLRPSARRFWISRLHRPPVGASSPGRPRRPCTTSTAPSRPSGIGRGLIRLDRGRRRTGPAGAGSSGDPSQPLGGPPRRGDRGRRPGCLPRLEARDSVPRVPRQGRARPPFPLGSSAGLSAFWRPRLRAPGWSVTRLSSGRSPRSSTARSFRLLGRRAAARWSSRPTPVAGDSADCRGATRRPSPRWRAWSGSPRRLRPERLLRACADSVSRPAPRAGP